LQIIQRFDSYSLTLIVLYHQPAIKKCFTYRVSIVQLVVVVTFDVLDAYLNPQFFT